MIFVSEKKSSKKKNRTLQVPYYGGKESNEDKSSTPKCFDVMLLERKTLYTYFCEICLVLMRALMPETEGLITGGLYPGGL